MTVDEIKSKLQRCRFINLQIEMHEEELDRLYSIAEKVTTTLSQMPVHGSDGDKMANNVVNIVEMEKAINSKICELIAAREEAEVIMSALKEPRQRLVIECYYFSTRTWEQCCVKLNYSWRQIHRIHSNALCCMAEKMA